VGPPLVYFNEKYNFTWFETNVYAIIGGMMGVIIFMHISEWLIEAWQSVRKYFFRRKMRRRPELFSPPVADTEEAIKIHYQYIENSQPYRKIFTPQSRRVIKIWRKFGIIGLAALTPVLFSIPIGTFFMTRFEKSRRRIIFYMFVSITSWSLLLTTIFELMHVRSIHDIIH
jgi:hypothetical protein